MGKARHNSRIESSLGCTQGALRVVLCKNSSILLAGTGVRHNISVVSGFINIHVSESPKILIRRINEVNVFFNKISL